MAIHKNKSRLAYANISEFIKVAKDSLSQIKSNTKDGNCVYGAPAFALLLASIDAMGAFYDRRLRLKELPSFKKINGELGACKSHFEKIQTLNPDLLEVSDAASLYSLRNDILHNAVIGSDYILTLGDNQTPLFKDNNIGKTEICLERLYYIVNEVYKNFVEDYKHLDPGFNSHLPSIDTAHTASDMVCSEPVKIRQNDANLDKISNLIQELTTEIHAAGIRDQAKQKSINGLLNRLTKVSNDIVDTYGVNHK